METSAVMAALLSPTGQAAVAAGEAGKIVRIAREAHGWNQHELARRSGYSQPTISRLERGVGRVARDVTVLSDLAAALGVPPGVLGVLPRLEKAPTLDGVDRRAFLTSTITVAVAAMLPQPVATPGRIGAVDVAQCRAGLRRLFQLDDHYGGGTVYEIAAEMAGRLQDALRRGVYGRDVEQDLQAVAASTMEHAGWLAYDAGRGDAAKRWWLETCHLTDIANLPDARVAALTSMALHATTSGAPRDAVKLIGAARSQAGHRASPTLLSLLAAREAVALAQMRDASSAKAAVATAKRELESTAAGGDPLWLEFWNTADLACHETRVALALGDGWRAEHAARTAVRESDKLLFPRNHMIYQLRLGRVLTRTSQLDEAVAVIGDALRNPQMLGSSKRIGSDLAVTLDLLEQHNHAPARTFAEAARRIAAISV
jgi:transcriptional regulator with XRE-family HTH domain